ncbi:MAG TPA: AAA family ATPase [Thermoanaerobaculia bacterium]|nr:AAA family ATPase [Thermoanaerobaculia bacterium]
MKKPPHSRLRFTRVVLENWRNFKRVEVPLQGRVFLVGPNASGKSNFLDAFRFLHQVVAIGGGFQQAIEDRRGVSMLRCLAARRDPVLGITVHLGDDKDPDLWIYELRFNQKRKEDPCVTLERVIREGTEILQRPDAEDRKDPARLSQTYLEQVHANRAFREIREFFGSIRYLHIVPQLIREPERSGGRASDPYGTDLMEQIARAPDKTRNTRLSRIEGALRIAVPQLQNLELERDPVTGKPHLRGKYEHWRPQGQWQREGEFSDGTLRLFGLLWSLLEPGGPLLLEEPELSLHPQVVRHIPQMFHRMQSRSGRQVIVSTHSTELLSDEGLGLDEVLLLQPDREGTHVFRAADHQQVDALLRKGVPLGEAVLPLIAPQGAEQLARFGT